ncbi:MAG: hypothetical protein ACOCUZ_02280 [bacterium]
MTGVLAVVMVALAGCVGQDRIQEMVEDQADEAESGSAASSTGSGSQASAGNGFVLDDAPGLCDFFTLSEASELLGGEARLSEVPLVGEPGAPCSYVVSRERQLSFELMPLSHDVFNPAEHPLDEWVAWLDEQTPGDATLQIWDGAPGSGGYLQHGDGYTGAGVITPFLRTAMMSDRVTGQWVLRMTLRNPVDETQRLEALRTVAEAVIAGIEGG